MTEVEARAALTATLSQFEVAGSPADKARLAMAGIQLRLRVFVIVLLCVQVTIFVLLAQSRLSAAEYGLAHLGSCLAGWIVWRLLTKPAAGTSVCVLQILVWTAFAGPFGTVVSAGLLIPARRHSLADEGDTVTGPSSGRQDLPRSAWLRGHLPLPATHTVRPLIDVIADGTQAEKFEALRIIAKRYDPALAPALRYAMADASAPVRVLAATVIAKLRMVYLEKVGLLQAELASKPGARSLRKLARARLELADSGLIDAPRARTEIALARAELDRAAEIDGAKETIRS